jgi:hypothetical protein
MKLAQWAAIVVLALMVGGITFVTVYLGGSNESARKPTEVPPSLTFPIKSYPEEGEPLVTTEIRQSGHQDFWFTNDSGQDVNVGLNEKGCTCSEVEVTVVPERYRPQILAAAAARVPWLPPRGLDSLTTLAALADREHLCLDWSNGEAKTYRLDKENRAVVPAGALGRVRLSWLQKEAKQMNNYADLWMGKRGGGANARLSVAVDVVEPLITTKEITVPPVYVRDLEKMKDGQRTLILCCSMTRASFRLKARVIHEHAQPESDPVETGKPVPLTGNDLQRLGNMDKMNPRSVKSGYAIPVIVRAAAQDGTPIEWGHFRRLVELSNPDEGIEPIQVRVTGEVRGDVNIGSGANSGAINLGPFPRSRVKRGSIVLQTDAGDLDLQLDASRLPDYLRARLNPAEKMPAGQRFWKLQVEVPANAARGGFPRNDDSRYRDSAIYVKIIVAGKPSRAIRIPVTGTANE